MLFPVFALLVLAVLLAVCLLSHFGVSASLAFVAALGSIHTLLVACHFSALALRMLDACCAVGSLFA